MPNCLLICSSVYTTVRLAGDSDLRKTVDGHIAVEPYSGCQGAERNDPICPYLMDAKPLSTLTTYQRDYLSSGFLYGILATALASDCRSAPQVFLGVWNEPFAIVARRVFRTVNPYGYDSQSALRVRLAGMTKIFIYLAAKKRQKSFLHFVIMGLEKKYFGEHHMTWR